MSGLGDIGVTVVHAPNDELRANVRAILHEIENLLEKLLSTGEENIIDIRSLPLLPGDYQGLEKMLGKGEVYAEIDDGNGTTVIVETGIAGVWWVTHYGEQDKVLAEFIEVTRIPPLLLAQTDDVLAGLDRLRMQQANSGGH